MSAAHVNDIFAFLLGEAESDGVWYGERHPTERGGFWWRKHLRAAMSAAPPAPAGEPTWAPDNVGPIGVGVRADGTVEDCVVETYFRRHFNNRTLRVKDLQEWSTAAITPQAGEVVERLPLNGVYVAIKVEHDKRTPAGGAGGPDHG